MTTGRLDCCFSVPLFYRTIRMFLEQMRKAWWLEAEPEAVVKTKNHLNQLEGMRKNRENNGNRSDRPGPECTH